MKDKIIEKLIEYVKHKSFCNINTNWDEAIQAMGDTPEQFRDESWQQAYDEMRHKMTICNCGLNNLIDELAALEAEQPKAEVELNHLKDEIWDKCYLKCSTLRETWRMAMEEYASQRNRLPSEEENLK